MTFCTVHAGKNLLTNITVKSILKFHPTAKIFIIDVSDPDTWLKEKFFPVDDDIMGNVEVINGISRKDENFKKFNLECLDIPQQVKQLIQTKLSSGIVRASGGDTHHSMNIQFAIDSIKENFILIDNDAPLIRPVDFWDQDFHIHGNVGVQEMLPGGVCFKVFQEKIKRIRPFIQYMNVKFMKDMGIQYFNEQLILQNMDCSFFVSSKGFTGFMFPTGSLLYKQAVSKEIPIHDIQFMKYIDHFCGGTWSDKNPSEFYSKYIHLFKNREPFNT